MAVESERRDWKRIGLNEIFQQDGQNKSQNKNAFHMHYNNMERKSNFEVHKRRPAPAPPKGPVQLPKIGNYKPKMLLDSKEPEQDLRRDNTHGQYTQLPFDQSSYSSQSETKSIDSRPLIMGDKNVPLVIAPTENETDRDPIPRPRYKKKMAPKPPPPPPPESITSHTSNSDISSHNPLFTDEEQFVTGTDSDYDVESQGGVVDFGEMDGDLTTNPLFQENEPPHIPIEVEVVSGTEEEQDTMDTTEDEGEFPYIPPPDYDEDEITMNFDDEPEVLNDPDYVNRRSHMYKEYEGEDFGKYLKDDEDYEFDRPYTSRRKPARPPPPQKYQAPKHEKKSQGKTGKKKSIDKGEMAMKRNTIRDFTFSDSKIGWGDRTVKSTSAKGRVLKREKERRRVDHPTTFQNGNAGPGSYEEFLRVRAGQDTSLESPTSSDSGLEIGDDRFRNDIFYHSQPKEMRKRQHEGKSSLWKKFTWKFRRTVGLSTVESR